MQKGNIEYAISRDCHVNVAYKVTVDRETKEVFTEFSAGGIPDWAFESSIKKKIEREILASILGKGKQ